MTPASALVLGLSIALGVSLVGNAALGRAYLSVRDRAQELANSARNYKDAASSCTAGVEAILKGAAEQTTVAQAAIAAARSSAAQRSRRADAILSTPASVPGDDCASAKARADRWTSERVNP